PRNLLPLAAFELDRVLQAVRVVRDAVLAHRSTLGAVRAEIERRIEHRLLADPDAVLHHRVDRTADGAVRAHRALDLELSVLFFRLGLADHAERQLRGHGAGADRQSGALEETAPVDGFIYENIF